MRRGLGGAVELDDDPERIDIPAVHRYLAEESYWARGRPYAVQERLVREASRVVGLYDGGDQIGFCRAVSAFGMPFVYLADVYVLPSHRGRSFGVELVREMIEQGPFDGEAWILNTSDAHGLYRRFGFEAPHPRTMVRRPGGAGDEPFRRARRVSGEAPDERLEEARRLDAEAIRLGEEGPEGRALRARAGALRLEVIGSPDYPLLLCAACFRVTGWTGDDGRCHFCLHHAASRARATNADWPSQPPAVYPAPRAPAPLPLGVRLAAGLGGRGRLERIVTLRWLEHVDPAQTGPIDPEPGFEVEVALRDEIERVDGRGLLVRFASATHRFGASGWERLASTRVGRSSMPNPAEFAAELRIEQLASAWADYRAALEAINRRHWAEEEARREGERGALEERLLLLREQAHTADLLEE